MRSGVETPRREVRKAWARGICAGLLLLAPRSGSVTLVLGPRVEVPWLAAAEPLGVSVAVLADGSFAIAATVYSPDGTIGLFQLQCFDAKGRPKDEPVQVLSVYNAGGVNGWIGGVGSLGDRYFVTWATAPGKAWAALYDPNGVRLGKIFSWPWSALALYRPYYLYYRFGLGPRWSFLPIAFITDGVVAGGEPFYRPTLQLFASNARPLDSPLLLDPGRRIILEDAAVGGQGSSVVLWDRCAADFQSCVRGMQILDPSGAPRSPFLTEGIEPFGDGSANGGFRTGINSRGQVLLDWVQDRLQPQTRLVLRLFDPNGAPRSAALPVAEAPVLSPLEIQAQDGGGFILPWAVYAAHGNAANPTVTVFAREFDPLTQTLSEPATLFTTETVGGLALDRVALNGAGHGVVLWQAYAETPASPQLLPALLRVIHRVP